MPSIGFRINFFIFKLVKYIVNHFIPKSLRSYVPALYVEHQQDQKEDHDQQEGKNASFSCSSSLQVQRGATDANELKKVFEMFDRDNDGVITKDELNDSFRSMGILIPDGELAQMMEKIDANGDGCIDMDEFEALYQSITGMNSDENGVEVDMKEAFDVFDQNRDGFITADELKMALASLGLGRMEDCEMMIKRVDEDGDGRVNFSEFKQMLRAHHSLIS